MQKKTNVTLSLKGALILGLAGIILIAAIFAITVLPLRFNPAMVQGMKIIRSDPAVAESFGTPIRQSLLVTGVLHEYSDGGGIGNLWTPISGPKHHAEAYISVSRPAGGTWQLTSISIHVNRFLMLIWYADKSNLGFQYVPLAPSPSSTPIQPPTEVPTP
jgi:hypothetical protein